MLVQKEQRKLLTQVVAHTPILIELTRKIAQFVTIGIDYANIRKEVNYRAALIEHRRKALDQDPHYAQRLIERAQLKQTRKELAGYNPDQIAERKLELHHLAQQKCVSTGSDPKHLEEVGSNGKCWLKGYQLERRLKIHDRNAISLRVLSSIEQTQQEEHRATSYGHLEKISVGIDRRPRSVATFPSFSGKYYNAGTLQPGQWWNQSAYPVDDVD
jgi:hypothetical protein